VVSFDAEALPDLLQDAPEEIEQVSADGVYDQRRWYDTPEQTWREGRHPAAQRRKVSECPIVSRLLDNNALKAMVQYSCNKAPISYEIGHMAYPLRSLPKKIQKTKNSSSCFRRYQPLINGSILDLFDGVAPNQTPRGWRRCRTRKAADCCNSRAPVTRGSGVSISMFLGR
jgi:hypothetical protein